MAMLRRCSHPGCTTLTLGRMCVRHELDDENPDKSDPANAVPLRQGDRLVACHREAPAFEDYIRSAFGYRVSGPDGRLGTVSGHIHAPDGHLTGLTIRHGLLRRRESTVPVDTIEWVLPNSRQLFLAAGTQVEAPTHPWPGRGGQNAD
jgi:hypothetical protein